MAIVNMHEAKTRLSQLVAAVESGSETEIVIARNGKPAARIVPAPAGKPTGPRLGVAAAEWKDIDFEPDPAADEAIARLFYGDGYDDMMQKVAETRKRMKLPPL
jgi:prevent-host-death family protein